ncbi:MAG: 30S ribosomal protein S4 [Chlamydiota bacterium]
MSRYRGPKNKIARRFQANVFSRARNPMLHKNNPPGIQGARRRKKSDYGLQLEEKQKLKAAYGMITEKQLVNYYRKAIAKKGNTAHQLVELLEARLDNIVFRLKLAPTIFAAHQLVSHGHILVDGKKVDVRSFRVKPGMVISIREKSKNMDMIKNSVESGRDIPEYLSLDKEKLSGTMVSEPAAESIDLPMIINTAVVCELLAHTK